MAAEDYLPTDYIPDDEYDEQFDHTGEKWSKLKMLKKKFNSKKPTLVKVGRHFINPNDVRCISQVRDDLFIVKYLSESNPEYACWVEKKDIAALLNNFNIIVSD